MRRMTLKSQSTICVFTKSHKHMWVSYVRWTPKMSQSGSLIHVITHFQNAQARITFRKSLAFTCPQNQAFHANHDPKRLYFSHFKMHFKSLIWESFAFTKGKIRLSNQERVRIMFRNGFRHAIRSFVNRPNHSPFPWRWRLCHGVTVTSKRRREPLKQSWDGEVGGKTAGRPLAQLHRNGGWIHCTMVEKLIFVQQEEGTRKNDHHREGQRKEKERPAPPTSRLKDIKSSIGMTIQEAVRAAEDRERWQRIMKTTASHNATSDWARDNRDINFPDFYGNPDSYSFLSERLDWPSN